MSSSTHPNTSGKVVVITGASAGIGAAAAHVFASRGAKVVLVARREEALRSVAAGLPAGAESLVVVGDITKRADNERVLTEAVAKFGQVDVWINNAGKGIGKFVMDLTDEDIDEMVLVNVKSAVYGMQIAGKHFLERGAGQIVNISGVLGRVPIASFRSAYAAAKHMLNALTANARMDLRGVNPNVKVTLVMPGPVSTEFSLNVRGHGVDARGLPGHQSAEEVATVIADAVETPVAEVYTNPGHQKAMVAAYFAADADVGAIEQRPPFMNSSFKIPPPASKPAAAAPPS